MPDQPGKSQQRQQRILDAAIAVFSRHSYHTAAMDEIAAEAQTSKGGLYFHFPSKQSIFSTLIDKMASLLLGRVAAAMEQEAEFVARGDAALRAVLHSFAGHPTLAKLFLIEGPGAGAEFNAKIMQIHTSFITLVRDYLDEGVRRGVIEPLDTDLAATAWFGAVNEVVVRWLLSDRLTRLEETYPALRELLSRSTGMGQHSLPRSLNE